MSGENWTIGSWDEEHLECALVKKEFDTIFIMFCLWLGVVGLTTVAIVTSAALFIS